MSEPKIGFTPQQIHDLRQRADRLSATAGNPADDRVWFARYVGIYCARLALDAETERLPVRHVENEISTRVLPEVRWATLLLLQNSRGGKLTAENLLDLLKAGGPIDDAIGVAVQSDVDRLKAGSI